MTDAMKAASGKLARGYSWPPFEPGNTLGVRHGAFSSRLSDPVTNELVQALCESRPDLLDYPEAVWAWARAEARCILMSSKLDLLGLLDDDGEPRAGCELLAKWERNAVTLRERLGIDPKSHIDLVRAKGEVMKTAVDLAALRKRGEMALQERTDAEAAT